MIQGRVWQVKWIFGFEDLALGRYQKTSLGTWLVTIAKKLWRQRTEVQGESPTLEIGRFGSPRDGCSCFGEPLVSDLARWGPRQKGKSSPVCSYGTKQVLDSQQECNPAYVFWFKLIPNQVISRENVLTQLRWVYNFYMSSGSTFAKHFAASSAVIVFGTRQTWVWIPDPQFMNLRLV